MNTRLVAIGGLQVDNVVTPNGEAAYILLAEMEFTRGAVGAHLWSRECRLIGQVAENFPSSWLKQLQDAGR